MNRDSAADYIRANFEPSDRLAVVVRSRQTKAVTQRLSSADHIASQEIQGWLRHRNAQGDDIYLSMNALKPQTDRRTKENVGEIRHIYLDFDQEGQAAVGRLIENAPVPIPSRVVQTSPNRRHVIWRVEGFTKEEAEQMQKYLAQQWGADPAATDSARVLRLPGFYNHKYAVPFRVRTEVGYPSQSLYRPEHFPEIPLDGLSRNAEYRQIQRSTPFGAPSQSERDWAFAKRALTRGESMDSVVAAVAAYRRDDKSNPEYYAAHTVRKAAAALAHERQHPAYETVDFER